MKKILMACGTGVAVLVTERLNNGLKERGLANTYQLVKGKLSEAEFIADQFDIVITASMIPEGLKKSTTPVIDGVPLLTGVGADKVYDAVAELLRK